MNRVLRHSLKQAAVVVSWLFFFSWFDWAAALSAARRKPAGLLLVKMDAIGDLVLAVPVIQALSEAGRGNPVTLFCDGRAAALARLLFPGITVIALDTGRFFRKPGYRWKLLRQIREISADVVINLAMSPELWWGDSLVRASRAPQRLGIAGHTDRIAPALAVLCGRWYTRRVPLPDDHAFAADALCACVEALGYPVEQMCAPALALPADAAAKAPPSPYFAMAPGSLRAIKQWPPEYFADLAGRLFAATGWQCVLLGAPSDAPASGAAAALMQNEPLDLTGKTSLVEAMAILRGARLLIANDSALVHIAALCGVRVVSTLGGGHPERFLPYPEGTQWLAPVRVVMHSMPCFNCHWQCIYPVGDSLPAPCITGIPVDAMWDEVRRVTS